MNNLITYDNKLIENDSKLQVVKKGHFLAKDYQDDVLAIPNTKLGRFSYTKQLYQWLVENNLYDNLVLAAGSDYGNLINSVPPDSLIQTAYDLSKFGNNPTQGVEANQPKLINNSYYNPSGDFRHITFPNISFAQGDNHTVVIVGKLIQRPFSMIIGRTGTVISSIYMADAVGNPRIYFRSESNITLDITDAITTPNFFDGNYNQVAISVKGEDNTVSSYFNGGLIKTTPLPSNNFIYNTLFRGSTDVHITEGSVKSLFIFSKNLSQSEISSLNLITNY